MRQMARFKQLFDLLAVSERATMWMEVMHDSHSQTKH